jgi:hypothetical protein
MKRISFLTISIFSLICTSVNAQVFFKTEYIGTSGYHDENNNKVGDSKGSALIYQGGINLPVYIKMNENNRPVMWGVGIGGTYASLNNRNFTQDLVLQEILNMQIGLMHIRPLNDKWSMMASIGAGIYCPDTRLSDITYKNVLGNAGIVFIRHLKPDLDLGGGLAINNTFGYPMAFPAFYLDWKYEKNFVVKVSLMDGAEIVAGYNVSRHLSLNLIASMNGQMALLEQDGEDKIFTHQYATGGFSPEVRIGKYISIPLTVGVCGIRMAYYDDRSLKAMFANGRDYEPYFQVSPYCSATLKIGF